MRIQDLAASGQWQLHDSLSFSELTLRESVWASVPQSLSFKQDCKAY